MIYHNFRKNLTLSWHSFAIIPDFVLNKQLIIFDFVQVALLNLGDNVRFRNYEEAFYWLDDACLINIAYNATEPNIGLGQNDSNFINFILISIKFFSLYN